MAKQPGITFGTKAEFTPTRGSRIGEVIKQNANLLTVEQRAILGEMAKQIMKGAAYGKTHAHRR